MNEATGENSASNDIIDHQHHYHAYYRLSPPA